MGKDKVLLTLLLLLFVPCWLQASNLPPAGATGYCLTEVEGGRIEKIPLVVLGALQGTSPGSDSILVRLEHPMADKVGVAAGMSGSPVYVGGELVGAIAFTWSYSELPIGGVTPLDRMRQVNPLEGSGGRGAEGASMTPEELVGVFEGHGAGAHRLLSWLRGAVQESSPKSSELPLVLAASVTPPKWLQDAFSLLGFLTVSAPSGGAATIVDPSVKPGSMVAALLVSGDLMLAAGGTVTMVSEGKVWAFGHPLFALGSLEAPMAPADVVAILPRRSLSMKLFVAGDPVGSFTQDRGPAIAGILGRKADTLPVSVEIEGRSYSYRLARHRLLEPVMVAYVASASMAAFGKQVGRQTVSASMTCRFQNGSSFAFSWVDSGEEADDSVAGLLGSVIAFLNSSPFPHPSLASLDVKLSQRETAQAATIEWVNPAMRRVKPGQPLKVTVRVLVEGGGYQDVQREITLPKYMKPGKVDLIVADGASWNSYRLKHWPARPESFKEDIELLKSLLPPNVLVMAVEAKGASCTLGNRSLLLPLGARALMEPLAAGKLKDRDRVLVALEKVRLPWPLSGSVRRRLVVSEGY